MIIVLIGLRLKNFALIKSLELKFDAGFTVLTGETGAGKSILLDALHYLLGGNTSHSAHRFIRQGETSCHIEASFLVTPLVKEWLDLHFIEIEDKEIFIFREFHLKESKLINRCRINGVIVNRSQILELRPLLIDLTSQGQSQTLFSSSHQLSFLDEFANKELKQALDNVSKAWTVWKRSFNALNEAKLNQEEIRLKNDYLQEILLELESANLFDDFEYINLQQEQDRLVHSVRLQQSNAKFLSILEGGGDSFPSLLEQFASCINELKLMSNLDSSLSQYLDQSISIQSDLNDLSSSLQNYLLSLESDPTKLHNLQERLSFLNNLQIKYSLDLPGLISKRNELHEKLTVSNSSEVLIDLENKEKIARETRDQSNRVLSQKRKLAAEKLVKLLLDRLPPLGLEHALFNISFTKTDPSIKGMDVIDFMFSANPDQKLSPLEFVASGGEMSRFWLALKTILSGKEELSTLLFDEIDTGVSGKISVAIANALKSLSQKNQVFCVTHQPLVAAAADHHFSVTKSIEQGVTHSKVRILKNIEERQNELSELAGGDLVEASAYVASLLNQKAA